jgi:hypothetical protein
VRVNILGYGLFFAQKGKTVFDPTEETHRVSLYDARVELCLLGRTIRRAAGANDGGNYKVRQNPDTPKAVTARFDEILANPRWGFSGCGVAPQLLYY